MCVLKPICPRIFALRPSEILFAVLDTSNSNEQRRQFLVHLDQRVSFERIASKNIIPLPFSNKNNFFLNSTLDSSEFRTVSHEHITTKEERFGVAVDGT